jgi:ribose-phosphate pyrophosphokinase
MESMLDDTILYLCSTSKIKLNILKKFADTLKNLTQCKYIVFPVSMDWNTPDQPVGEGTYDACKKRISVFTNEYYTNATSFKIFSLENGIYINDVTGEICDICVLIVQEQDGTQLRFNSFGIQIDPDLFGLYLAGNRDGSRIGTTFGKFLSVNFGVEHDNWSLDQRFGGISRLSQMEDCLNKYLIHSFTEKIANYPREGVMFMHATSIVVNPILFNIMFDIFERFVGDNFDMSKIDYVAGLDARGFYFAPVLARLFKKSFIPIRKASKLPLTEAHPIVTESYTTEYSDDMFGLEERAEYRTSLKGVLIVDDLLATGGSIIGAANVLRNVGLAVIGAVTLYDVNVHRDKAHEKLLQNNIVCKVVLYEGGVPNDIQQLKFKIPSVMLQRVAKTSDVTRYFTLSDDEWANPSESSRHHLQLADAKIMYAAKDKDLANDVMQKLCTYASTAGSSISDICVDVVSELFSNGETRVEFKQSVRNAHVVIISRTRTGHINNDFIELLLMMDACTRSQCSKITVVMPYYPYARSDKKDSPHCPIASSTIAKILTHMHADNVISLDLHAGQIQGYIDKGFHNLYIKRYMCEYIYKSYLQYFPREEWNQQFILVAPDAGSSKAIRGYSSVLGINNIVMDKQRDYSKPGTVSRSVIIGEHSIYVGRTAIVIDDMADTMGTMCSAAKELVKAGIKEVLVLVTHGVLSGKAIENINCTECIKEVSVTNSLPQDANINASPKIRVIDCSELLARTIDGIFSGKSISRLF